MIIDFHTHMYPDNVAPKALANLLANNGVAPHTAGTKGALLTSMDCAGVDMSVVLPVANRMGQFPKLNDFARDLTVSEPRILSFGSVYHQEPQWREQIRYIKDIGLKGMKLHPDFQEFYFHEKRIIDMVSYALDIGLLVTVHAGVDPACLELVHSTPQMVRYLIDRVDSEHLIVAHLGGHLYWDEVLEYVADTNCYIDTALCVGAINQKKLISILDKHGYDRVLFGSDTPWGDQPVSVRFMDNLLISDEHREMIFHKNAEKLLGI